VTEFWGRMHEQFGNVRGDSIARDQVLAELGGRTAREALEAGVEPREVWLAICRQLDVPVRRRH
jgi:hypothetical protein